MFAKISGVYDLLNHTLSFGIDKYWRKELAILSDPGKKGIVLDLASGTFDVVFAIHKRHPDATIFAMDFCLPMLKKGMAKLRKKDFRIPVLACCADALELPVKQGAIDCISMAFGIRNISSRVQAFKQMRQALKPGGKVCILEFGSAKEKIWFGSYNFYLNSILPLIGKFVAGDEAAYSYLAKTIREFPSADVLAEEMKSAGFADTGWRKLSNGIACLHWGYKPL